MADTEFAATPRIKAKASNNVYTALLAIAFLALTGATVVVWKTNVELTKGLQPQGALPNPFFHATPEQIEKAPS